MTEAALIISVIALCIACAVIKWQADKLNKKDSDNG